MGKISKELNMLGRGKADAKPDRILPGITSFDWNADRSRVAVCP